MNRTRLVVGLIVVVALLVLAGGALAAQGTAPKLVNALVDPTPTPGAQASQTAFLGITMVAVGDKAAAQFNIPAGSEGAVILKVTGNSPAATAGLQSGDLITSVNDVAVKSPTEVTTEVRKHKPGDVISLAIKRGANAQTIQVTAGTAPAKSQQKMGGALGANLPPELQGLQNVPANELFSHLYGSTTRFTDANGNVVTVNSIPGTVTAISATSITIKPNDPQGRGGPFSIDSTTRILAAGRGGGSDNLAVNDKVTVVVVGDSNHASMIARGAALEGMFGKGMLGFHGNGAADKLHDFMQRGFPNPRNRGQQGAPKAVPTPGTTY